MRVYRIDTVDSELGSPVEGPAGSLLLSGYAARPGIYLYRNRDGSIRREYVPKEALWDKASIETLGRAPVTLEHPEDFVTDENAQELTHGDVDGEIVEGKDGYVKIKMAVRTKDAKTALKNGKVELSPGYYANIDDNPGVYVDEDGVEHEYDSKQLSREYNHLAIVDVARGGQSMRLRTDSDVDIAIMERTDQEAPMGGRKTKNTDAEVEEPESQDVEEESEEESAPEGAESESAPEQESEEEAEDMASKIDRLISMVEDLCKKKMEGVESEEEEDSEEDSEEGAKSENMDSADPDFQARVDAAVAERLDAAVARRVRCDRLAERFEVAREDADSDLDVFRKVLNKAGISHTDMSDAEVFGAVSVLETNAPISREVETSKPSLYGRHAKQN